MDLPLCKMIQELLYGYVELWLFLGLGFMQGEQGRGWSMVEWGCEGIPKGGVGCQGTWVVRNFVVQCVTAGEENPKGCIACLSLLHNHSCFWGQIHLFWSITSSSKETISHSPWNILWNVSSIHYCPILKEMGNSLLWNHKLQWFHSPWEFIRLYFINYLMDTVVFANSSCSCITGKTDSMDMRKKTPWIAV